MAALRGIPLSKISPAFLHSNSTSHTWPFSAIAELIDNAYDPDVSANELWIDRVFIHGKPCLIFEDDGNGMDNEHLLNMLSFGYCEKGMYESKGYRPPIGHYGNGFKSGSMRLGKDALVFTVCKTSASVGFLSQTYLEAIKADCVFVPILEYRLPHLERFKSQESRNNLDAILKYSPFKTEKDIKEELRTIYARAGQTGTKIVLYNLKRHKNGALELDFESDQYDMRNPEAHEVDLTSVYHRTSQLETSEYVRSLRCYCGILFLKPRMKIYIRGVKVKSRIVSKSLSHTEIDVYRPTWLTKPLRITFGFTAQGEDYGVMFYHRNRLIKAFEKLGYQKQANDLGVGVVGVVQVDFLKPIHNKQDFEKDEKYNAIMSAIATKLNDYWNEKKNGQTSQQVSQEANNVPDWLWVQCENCLKWRRLPDSHRAYALPDVWFCHMNPDPTHNRCDIEEEPEDEDEAVSRPTYQKTYKKIQEEKKRRRQADIEAKERELQAKEAELLERQRRQQMNEVSSSQESRRNLASLQKELMEAKKREETQKRLILQIQQQKKQLEQQHQSLMVAAQSLQSANTTSAELLEVADALSGNSVSSTSGRTTRGKRKSTDDSLMGGKRRISIKTETGEMLAITTNEDFDDDTAADEDATAGPSPLSPPLLPIPSTSSQPPPNRPSAARMFATAAGGVNARPSPTPTPKPALKRGHPCSQTQTQSMEVSADGVIDLTLDDDEEGGYNVPEGVVTGEQPDIKPNVEELDRQMAAERQSAENLNQFTEDGVGDDYSGDDTGREVDNASLGGRRRSSKSAARSERERSYDSDGSVPAEFETCGRGGDGFGSSTAAAITAASTVAETLSSSAKTSTSYSSKSPIPSTSGTSSKTALHTETASKTKNAFNLKDDEDRLKLLKHKYKLLLQRFYALQRNVHRLLSFIVPDVDLGSVDDIEHIVMEMIRVNCSGQEFEEMQDLIMKDSEKLDEKLAFLDEDSNSHAAPSEHSELELKTSLESAENSSELPGEDGKLVDESGALQSCTESEMPEDEQVFDENDDKGMQAEEETDRTGTDKSEETESKDADGAQTENEDEAENAFDFEREELQGGENDENNAENPENEQDQKFGDGEQSETCDSHTFEKTESQDAFEEDGGVWKSSHADTDAQEFGKDDNDCADTGFDPLCHTTPSAQLHGGHCVAKRFNDAQTENSQDCEDTVNPQVSAGEETSQDSLTCDVLKETSQVKLSSGYSTIVFSALNEDTDVAENASSDEAEKEAAEQTKFEAQDPEESESQDTQEGEKNGENYVNETEEFETGDVNGTEQFEAGDTNGSEQFEAFVANGTEQFEAGNTNGSEQFDTDDVNGTEQFDAADTNGSERFEAGDENGAEQFEGGMNETACFQEDGEQRTEQFDHSDVQDSERVEAGDMHVSEQFVEDGFPESEHFEDEQHGTEHFEEDSYGNEQFDENVRRNERYDSQEHADIETGDMPEGDDIPGDFEAEETHETDMYDETEPYDGQYDYERGTHEYGDAHSEHYDENMHPYDEAQSEHSQSRDHFYEDGETEHGEEYSGSDMITEFKEEPLDSEDLFSSHNYPEKQGNGAEDQPSNEGEVNTFNAKLPSTHLSGGQFGTESVNDCLNPCDDANAENSEIPNFLGKANTELPAFLGNADTETPNFLENEGDGQTEGDRDFETQPPDTNEEDEQEPIPASQDSIVLDCEHPQET